MREDFASAFLKLERAEHHIDQFKQILAVYVAENLKAIEPEPDRRKWETRLVGGRLPRHTPTVVGDVIHNMRTSLDHAYCALVEANGGTVQRFTTFPFHKDRTSAAAALKGHKLQGCAPSDDAIMMLLDQIQPFEGSEIYGVHALDIADKHHSLIATKAAFVLYDVLILKPDGSYADQSLSGGGTIVCDYGIQAAALGLKNGYGAKLLGYPETYFEVRFGENQPFADKSIKETLTRLLKVTKAAVDRLSTV